MNLRHKDLAHSLTETRLERKGLVQRMKYGDKKWLVDETVAVVQNLHLGINMADFAFEPARMIARRNAEALWGACARRRL